MKNFSLSLFPVSFRYKTIPQSFFPLQKTHTFILLKLRATPKPLSPTIPRCIVLVIDASSAAQRESFQQITLLSEALFSLLSEEDQLGVVAFDASAKTLLPLHSLRSIHADALQAKLRALSSKSRVNLSAGLSHAALLFPPSPKQSQQSLLLLSGGRPNLGTITQKALEEEIALLCDRKIQVSTFGLGKSPNKELLQALATTGDGQYSEIHSPTQISADLECVLGKQTKTLITDISYFYSAFAEHL